MKRRWIKWKHLYYNQCREVYIINTDSGKDIKILSFKYSYLLWNKLDWEIYCRKTVYLPRGLVPAPLGPSCQTWEGSSSRNLSLASHLLPRAPVTSRRGKRRIQYERCRGTKYELFLNLSIRCVCRPWCFHYFQKTGSPSHNFSVVKYFSKMYKPSRFQILSQ